MYKGSLDSISSEPPGGFSEPSATEDPVNSGSGSLWDQGALARTLRGNMSSVRRVCLAFLEECPRYREGLSHALEIGDDDGLHRAAHRLKGAAGMLRATSLQRAAAELDEAAKSGRLQQGPSLLNGVHREMESLMRILEHFVASEAE